MTQAKPEAVKSLATLENEMIFVNHAAEVYDECGPVGFAEVTEGKIVDYGNNTLFEGTVEQCNMFATRESFLLSTTPHRWIPTKWTRNDEICGAHRTWNFVTE